MQSIPDKSVDLVIADIPYNIGKDKRWDKWKKQSDYIDFIGKRFLECQRVLKDNGSFYWFHNDFLQVVDIQNWISQNTKFVFKQMIVWNKRFNGSKNKSYLDGYVAIEQDRNYRLMAEYIFFYTFQDETGLTTVMLDTNNFSTLRRYFKNLQEYLSVSKKYLIDTIGQKADHCFRWKSTQWDMPTPETYSELKEKFNIDKWAGFKEYESLRQEYESLRQEYESLRYTFNNHKTHHSVWEYEIANKVGHCTPKPLGLIENIINHSSNEGDTVLDPFSGSGTTAIACINTNRNYICIEKDKTYFELSTDRVNNHKQNLFNKAC